MRNKENSHMSTFFGYQLSNFAIDIFEVKMSRCLWKIVGISLLSNRNIHIFYINHTHSSTIRSLYEIYLSNESKTVHKSMSFYYPINWIWWPVQQHLMSTQYFLTWNKLTGLDLVRQRTLLYPAICLKNICTRPFVHLRWQE